MQNKDFSQSINISSSNVSKNQFGSGETVNQTQYCIDNSQITEKQVLDWLSQLEEIVAMSALSPAQKQESSLFLNVAKSTIDSEKPDKGYIAKTLQKFTEIVKGADETAEVSQSLWSKVQPVFRKLTFWLGVAVDFFS